MATRFSFPPYANGWFQIAYSDELSPGEARPLHNFGRDFVLFRTETGVAHVLDAHCPHLGAHLGHGGKVEGEVIRCPFHAYTFDGNGSCIGCRTRGRSRRPRSWPAKRCARSTD